MPDLMKGTTSPAVSMDSRGPLGCGPHYARTPGTVGVCDVLDPTKPQDDKNKPATGPVPSGITSGNLDTLLGKTIEDICGKYGEVGDKINHCAHFVSHVLRLRLPGAALCSNVGKSKHTYKERRDGYCVRVNEIFNTRKNRAYWDDDAPPEGVCLIFATLRKVIASESPLSLEQMDPKHIGFYMSGVVYHYSNTKDKVITQKTDDFKRHYGKDTILLTADLPL